MLSFWSLFGLAVLAVYRLALMITSETGPGAVFRRFRDWIGKRFPAKNYQQHWIDEGVNCPWCVSFWLSWIAALVFTRPANVVDYCLTALGIAGATVALLQYLHSSSSSRGR